MFQLMLPRSSLVHRNQVLHRNTIWLSGWSGARAKSNRRFPSERAGIVAGRSHHVNRMRGTVLLNVVNGYGLMGATVPQTRPESVPFRWAGSEAARRSGSPGAIRRKAHWKEQREDAQPREAEAYDDRMFDSRGPRREPAGAGVGGREVGPDESPCAHCERWGLDCVP